jgi:hypothetical protein
LPNPAVRTASQPAIRDRYDDPPGR